MFGRKAQERICNVLMVFILNSFLYFLLLCLYVFSESVIGGSCQCSIVGCTVNRTIDAIVQEQIEEIKQILSVDKQQLSSTVRKKTCANDTRQSSVAMGTLGVAVLVVVFGAVMSADLLFFVSLCKNIYLRVKNRLT
jgi:hypothetical protein